MLTQVSKLWRCGKIKVDIKNRVICILFLQIFHVFCICIDTFSALQYSHVCLFLIIISEMCQPIWRERHKQTCRTRFALLFMWTCWQKVVKYWLQLLNNWPKYDILMLQNYFIFFKSFICTRRAKPRNYGNKQVQSEENCPRFKWVNQIKYL